MYKKRKSGKSVSDKDSELAQNLALFVVYIRGMAGQLEK